MAQRIALPVDCHPQAAAVKRHSFCRTLGTALLRSSRVATDHSARGDQGPDGLWATYPLVLQEALKRRVQSTAVSAGRPPALTRESQQPRSAHVHQRSAAGAHGHGKAPGRNGHFGLLGYLGPGVVLPVLQPLPLSLSSRRNWPRLSHSGRPRFPC